MVSCHCSIEIQCGWVPFHTKQKSNLLGSLESSSSGVTINRKPTLPLSVDLAGLTINSLGSEAILGPIYYNGAIIFELMLSSNRCDHVSVQDGSSPESISDIQLRQ